MSRGNQTIKTPTSVEAHDCLHGYEDAIDRFFFRKVSTPIAIVAAKLGWHPNLVSVLGMMTGVAGGITFHDPTTVGSGLGLSLLFASIVLDNADGQVARMTGKTSAIGYVLDGICDTLVFSSVYLACIVAFWPALGVLSALLVVAAAFCHSRQSAMLDFYKHQFLYWVHRRSGARFKAPAELRRELDVARGAAALFLRVQERYARQQGQLAGGRIALLPLMAQHRDRTDFPRQYARHQRLAMRLWFLMGPNWHFIPLFGCALLGATEWYFAIVLVPLNVLFAFALWVQSRSDRRFRDLLMSETPDEHEDCGDPRIVSSAPGSR